ncbi:MAG: TIM barrel protein [Streptosporangiales bacterium]
MSAPRIATAPISWGVCEVPDWGHQLDTARVLDEMRRLGFTATEAGPDGFLPGDGVRLRQSLAEHDLSLVGGFTPLVLHGEPALWRAALDRCLDRFAAAGGDVVVLAAATGLDGYDERPSLDAAGWARLLGALDEAAASSADRGLLAVLHPHLGTMVERPDETRRVLDGCGIPLCLDTGHVLAGGGDPVALAAEAAERVGHVHVKDVDATVARRFAAGEIAYSDAVRAGLYRPLGAGDVDVGALLAALQKAGYAGWYVLEQDVILGADPAPGAGPAVEAAESLAYLTGALDQTP